MSETRYEMALRYRGIEIGKRAKGNLYVRCPYHKDKIASLSISAMTGAFRCWGCGQKGAFYRLIAVWDGISEQEAFALEPEIDETGMCLKAVDEFFSERLTAPPAFNWDSFNAKFPSLKKGSAGARYLEGRGLHGVCIDDFDLRWGTHGRYENRVVIPIVDTTGRLVNYAGRSVDASSKPKTRKPVASRQVLFGLSRLWQPLGASLKWLVIVEGEPDAMYLQQFGVPAVATMGTAGLTAAQLALLVASAQVVVLSYDNDFGGRMAAYGYDPYAAKRNSLTRKGDADRIREYLPVVTVELPIGKDPNDLSERQVERIYGRYIP